ncbi:MAG: alpha/beta fold hydrolase [Candidatus Omnitrophica bacterium]|nr:alpha/beta fold hydrolase [Candidatus Omnitrophota bacterium]
MSDVIEGVWDAPSIGQRISYRLWKPPQARSTLVIIHGFGEHGGRYADVADALAAEGLCVAAPDLCGHGRSSGARGDIGDIPSCVDALEALTRQVLLPQTGHQQYALFGHSFGGLAAIWWAMSQPAGLRRLIVQSPLLETAFTIPAWKKRLSRLVMACWPAFGLSMNLETSALSHDPAVVDAYRQDPLVHNTMSARCYWSLIRTRDEAQAHPERVRVPTLLLYGTADRIVSTAVAQRWFDQLACDKQCVVFPDAYHELHHEPVRPEVLRRIAAWSLAAVMALALASSAVAEPPPATEETDWPTVIARLQQEVQQRPGLAHTRQQLAIAYNNYGVVLGNEGQWEQAVRQLQEAVQLDPANTQAKENLSRIYLNRAHEAYQQRRFPDALSAIELALQANPELAQAYALRGELEYNQQKLKEAKASWEQALKLDPSQPEIGKRLEQVTQELPVESDFERVSQASFDIRYQEGLESAIGFDVRDVLLQARREVGSDFAYWPKHRLVVLVYSAESFKQLRQETPEWLAGQFDGKIRVPLPSKQLNPQTVKAILFHEYTHALIYDLTNGTCPIWLNEGLAEYEGRRQAPGPMAPLRQAQMDSRLTPWKDLSDGFSPALTAEAVSLAYQQSYSIAAYLVERYGFWRIRRILKVIGEGKAWETALSDEFRLKLKTIEGNWQAWLPEFLRR